MLALPNGTAAAIPTGTVTFLFTDIQRSTELWEEDPGAMEQALVFHDAVIRGACEEHRGHVFATGGDGFAVAFSTPDDGVGAAIDAQLELTGSNSPLRVRMGIHTGAASERDGDYFGPTVNRCSRLAAAAYGGQIVLSEASRRLLDEIELEPVAFVDLGEHTLRGLRTQERVFQVVHPDLPSDFAPLHTARESRGRLPAPLSSFVGREAEVRDLTGRMSTQRLITLIGIGGAGKTRLAIEAAALAIDQYRDGVCFIDLAPLDAPELVAREIAEGLGIRQDSAGEYRDQVSRYLTSRQVLLVLDNCEHLVETCRSFVEHLLGVAPELSVLATSREALGVPGEVAYAVSALSVPQPTETSLDDIAAAEAVRLFVERAEAARSGFRLNRESAAAVAKIVRALDGIPLAIELAAARTKVLSPVEISSRLNDRFRLLTGGSRFVERHQTLRAAVDWSFDLLAPPEKQLFTLVSVFRGGFDLGAAVAVADDDEVGVLDALSSLVDKSLLVVSTSASGATRYRLLETLRRYGSDALEAGVKVNARDRHARHYARLAEKAREKFRGPDQAEAYGRIEEELDNMRAALDWWEEQGDFKSAQRLASALTWFWFVHRHMTEGRARLSTSVENASEVVDAPGAAALFGAGFLAATQGDYDEAEELLRRSYEIRARLGDVPGRVEVLDHLGMLFFYRGDLAKAGEYLRRARSDFIDLGDLWGAAHCEYFLARRAAVAGNLDPAIELLSGALKRFRALGDTFYIGWSSAHLGNTSLRAGVLDEAASYYQDALAAFEPLDDRAGLAFATAGLGVIAARRGDERLARSIYDRVTQYLEASPDSATALAAMQLDDRSINLLRAALDR